MLFGESEWGGACKRLAAAAKLQDSHQERERPSMCLCMWSEHIKYSFSLIQQRQQREREMSQEIKTQQIKIHLKSKKVSMDQSIQDDTIP